MATSDSSMITLFAITLVYAAVLIYLLFRVQQFQRKLDVLQDLVGACVTETQVHEIARFVSADQSSEAPVEGDVDSAKD